MWRTTSDSPETTRALGACLARGAPGGTVVALSGDLGAGKTCFAQGAALGLGIDDDVVSPTFVLVNEYEGLLLHADAYRLEPHELEETGLEELLEGWEGLALVEWAERVAEILPLDRLELRLGIRVEGRELEVVATGPRSEAVIAAWRAAWSSRGSARP